MSDRSRCVVRCALLWWAVPVEPISALLVIAGSYGAKAVVKLLTGQDELGALSSELVRALAASESRIDERLDRIESGLDELLEQSYTVALRRGVRFLLDATGSRGATRQHDLDRARDAFVEATAAARSPLQQAVAERYLLLTLLGLARRDAVPASLARVEEYATANAFDALRTSEHSEQAVAALLRREGGRGGDRIRQARYDVKQVALDSIGMSARLLAEMALVRPALGLPPVTAPPVEPLVDETVMAVTVKNTRDGLSVTATGQTTGDPYWTFEASPAHPLRLGSLTVTVSPEPAPIGGKLPPHIARAAQHHLRGDRRYSGHVQVELRAPLPVAVAVAATPTARATGRAVDIFKRSLAAGETVSHAPLQPSPDGTSWVRITPQYVYRSLIEVACRL
jgi:hypothetical protein